jgi:hypothetical protein
MEVIATRQKKCNARRWTENIDRRNMMMLTLLWRIRLPSRIRMPIRINGCFHSHYSQNNGWSRSQVFEILKLLTVNLAIRKRDDERLGMTDSTPMNESNPLLRRRSRLLTPNIPDVEAALRVSSFDVDDDTQLKPAVRNSRQPINFCVNTIINHSNQSIQKFCRIRHAEEKIEKMRAIVVFFASKVSFFVIRFSVERSSEENDHWPRPMMLFSRSFSSSSFTTQHTLPWHLSASMIRISASTTATVKTFSLLPLLLQ